ncbi:MAG: LLM class flavin-dependent oxidoreductase, partial [Actinomycetota bacterium]|nr:LLM class flavin-dependent oxidoreductase [Actinomycetota bacterium]
FGRMARHADGYIHGSGPPRVFARAIEQARAAWIDVGRPGQPEIWGQAYFALGHAAEEGRDYMRDYYAFTGPFAEKLAAGMLSSPQEIEEFAKAYEEGGCGELSLLPAVAELDQLDRLAEVVGSLS